MVGSRIDAIMNDYQHVPKSKSQKETVYHSRREVNEFYRRMMEIGQPIHDE